MLLGGRKRDCYNRLSGLTRYGDQFDVHRTHSTFQILVAKEMISYENIVTGYAENKQRYVHRFMPSLLGDQPQMFSVTFFLWNSLILMKNIALFILRTIFTNRILISK